MTYKEVLETILKIDDKIRFCTITDMHGNISDSGHHHHTQNLLTYIQSEMLLKLAVQSWIKRNLYEDEIGAGEYALAVYKKIKRITLRLNDDHLVYLTTERDTDHDRIISEIQKISI